MFKVTFCCLCWWYGSPEEPGLSLVLAPGQRRKYIKYRQSTETKEHPFCRVSGQWHNLGASQCSRAILHPTYGANTAPVAGTQIRSAASSVMVRMELQTCWRNKNSLSGEKQQEIQVHSYPNENQIDLFLSHFSVGFTISCIWVVPPFQLWVLLVKVTTLGKWGQWFELCAHKQGDKKRPHVVFYGPNQSNPCGFLTVVTESGMAI